MNNPTDVVRCSGCKWWDELEDEGAIIAIGFCHRLPPGFRSNPEEDEMDSHPITEGCDWCGEAQPK